MRYTRHLVAAACAASTLGAAAQEAAAPPVISMRTYVNGTIKVLVTGSFQVNEVVPINTQASYSDGQMTWLQYGVSGAETPNAGITVSPYEVGVTVARGKTLATAGTENCTGKMVVTANSIVGKYNCPGITSHNPAQAGLGEVDITVEFTAGS